MKYFLLFFLLVTSFIAKSQKYALLDEQLAKPVKYTNTVTSADEFNNLFPVEKSALHEFVKALQEIENKLASDKPFGKLPQYEIGCVKFTGRAVSLAGSERMDYVIASTCGNIKISMHLCDAKSSNAYNAFFIKTWVKYIESNMK